MDKQYRNSRYEIIRLLGEGGMGSVYLAHDRFNSNRLTAFKTINSQFLANPQSLSHFMREYEIMNRLRHPNLARVFDFGLLDEGSYYMAMEYVKGQELHNFIGTNQKLQFSAALPIMIDLLRVMEFIHSRNIIYGDIKPQNILITDENTVKLIDFGLSDFSNQILHKVKGTIKYMAPEIINSGKRSSLSDIFSLGVLFYEMLSGEAFYPEHSRDYIIGKLTAEDQFKGILNTAINKISDLRVCHLLRKMCAYNCNERFSSCAEIIHEINVDFSLNIAIETTETREAYVTGVPFTARETELKFLETFINSSDNRLLLVTGKQGIGKSALLTEFKQQCNLKNLFFLDGSSVNGESFEPFLEILTKLLFLHNLELDSTSKKYLRKLLPEHPVLRQEPIEEQANIDPKTQKDILVNIVSTLIINYSASLKSKLVLVFNEFDLTDDISLEIVDEMLYQMQISDLSNLKIIAECRTEELESLSDFLSKLEQKERITTVRLSEFSKHEVNQYIKNTFGASSVHPSILKKLPDLHKYCGGNPFFLQEFLKTMVSDGAVIRENRFWKMKKSVAKTKLSADLRLILKKRIDSLKLEQNYLSGLVFLSLSRQEKLSLEFYQKYVSPEINIDWQWLFDLLITKEFLVYKNGFLVIQNQLYRNVLHESMTKEEIIACHQLWLKILEKNIPANQQISEIDNFKLYDLGYHYYNSHFTDCEQFLSKTAAHLFEMGRREKEKYENKKAISCFVKLLDEFDRLQCCTDQIKEFKVKLYHNLAQVYEISGKWDCAEDLYSEALDLAVVLDDKRLIAENKSRLGWLIMNKGRYDDAMALFEDEKAISADLGDRQMYAVAVANIGSIYWYKGDYDRAMLCFTEKKQICQEIGDRSGYSKAVGNLGGLYWQKGNYQQAMLCFEELKQICLELGDRSSYSIAVGNIGLVHSNLGDYQQAMNCYLEQKQICLELGDKRSYAITVNNMGNIYWIEGNYNLAIQSYGEYKQICYELGDKKGYSVALGNMGLMYNLTGSYDLAIKCFEENKSIQSELGDFNGHCVTLANIGLTYYYKKEYEQSLLFYHEAITACRKLENEQALCGFLLQQAEVFFTIHDYPSAKSANDEAALLAEKIGRQDVVYSSTILAYKLLALSNVSDAVNQLTQLLQNDLVEENMAIIHYEIYQINQSAEHRRQALQLYQALYQKTPEIEYKNKIAELQIVE